MSNSAPVFAFAVASQPCRLHTPCTGARVRTRAQGPRRRHLRRPASAARAPERVAYSLELSALPRCLDAAQRAAIAQAAVAALTAASPGARQAPGAGRQSRG